MLPGLYLLLTLLFAAVLLALLWRPGAARGLTVWGLAALLPLLAAVAGALTGQARSARVLAGYTPHPVTVTVMSGTVARTLTLDAQDAACLERAVRLHTRSELLTDQAPVPLVGDIRVLGDLPPQPVVEALGIRGTLACPHLHTLKDAEDQAP
ncbi:hypothetical protein Dgeo_1585 [Deinococcus geothermalis DSM 11300]|uniref:Uncharacterized protein n=1 Tax=Deinococcus geothermalis (strain DSM 11300 / CIP 105573 / AG-3a) TaxID=319795 RepID=Q1IY04_DEIGD|nr:hypothetical protein [Deinococcus geothermalis]ABF45880.1 hypothetical protein Dgeo_1585 [Deinococcus geothermalis DSM 11300]